MHGSDGCGVIGRSMPGYWNNFYSWQLKIRQSSDGVFDASSDLSDREALQYPSARENNLLLQEHTTHH